jgi:hypothetical protein
MTLEPAESKFYTDLAVIPFSVASVVLYLSPTALWYVSDAFFMVL